MKRILAIDYGTKRCGIAVTDPLQITANPLDVVHTAKLHDFLNAYIRQEPVERLVVGEPTRLNGEPGTVESEIIGFLKRFKKNHPDIEVARENERNTSSMAVEAMIAGGMKKKKRAEKGQIDKVSAVLILQSYLGHR